MAASRMRRWAVPSSAGCCWPRWPRFSLFPHFSASSTAESSAGASAASIPLLLASTNSTRDRSRDPMTQQPNPNAQHGIADPRSAPEQNPLSPRKVVVGVVLVLLVFAVIAGVGILRRTHAGTVLAQHTDQLAPPTVEVAP